MATRARATAAFLLLATPTTSSAQEAPPAQGADASGVDSAQVADARDGALPAVTVPLPPAPPSPASAERRDPTGALTVIDVDGRRGEARDTASLLAEAPGLRVQQLGGFGQAQTVNLRGASSSGVLVLLDGVPLNGAGGVVDLSRLPTAYLSSLEVLRGGVGARYGSGALGGVINLVTRAPTSGFHGEVTATAGSFGTLQLQGSASGRVLGGEGLLVLTGARSQGDFRYLRDTTPNWDGDTPDWVPRENNDAAMGGLLARYRHPLGEGVQAEALAEYTLDERGLGGSVILPTRDKREAHQRVTASTRVVAQGEGGRELSARLYARTDAGPQSGQLYVVGGVELEGSALLADAHGLRARVELLRESFDSEAAVDPVWLRAALSLSDEWLLGEGLLTLVPALRLEQAGPFFLLSPKLGAILQLPAGFSLRANAGQSHRAPSFLELYVAQGGLLANPQLKPERALTADLGLEHAGETWRASATGFYSLYENLITYELYPPAAPRPHNFPGADVWGAEVWGSYAPGPWLSTSASWTLLFSRNLRDDPRYYLKELPYRPRHSLMLRTEVGPKLLRGRVQVEAQSDQFMNKTGNTLEKLPARAFLHLGLSSRLPLPGPRLTASLEVRNVLDTQGEDFRGYPLVGRSAFLTLSALLDGDSSNAGLSTQEQ